MKIKITLLICLLAITAQAQKQISQFKIDKRPGLNWQFGPQRSLEIAGNYYIIGSSQYKYESASGRLKDGLAIMQFDDKYNFTEKYTLDLGLPKLKNFNPLVIQLNEADPTDILRMKLLLHDNLNFFVYEGILNIKNKLIENIKKIYDIPLKNEYNEKYVKIINNDEDYVILELDKKNKKLFVYALKDEVYVTMPFDIEDKLFKRLKANFALFQQMSEERINELDLTPGFQIHFNNHNIHILSGDCIKEGPSLMSLATVGNCSSDYYFSDLHLISIDLESRTLNSKIIGDEFIRKRMGYTILDNELIYTYYQAPNIFLNALDLDSFKSKIISVNEGVLNTEQIKTYYTNYKKKSAETEKEEIDFSKFTAKFSKAPSLAIRKKDSLNYDITLGHVKYKAYNSFGDWLGAFAMANISSFASINASNNRLCVAVYYFNNEIPKIHKVRFITDLNESLKPLNDDEDLKYKEVILNNLDYFFKKKMVAPIGDVDNKNNFHVLLRGKNNWNNFFVVKF